MSLFRVNETFFVVSPQAVLVARAFAILFIVVSYAGGPGWLTNLSFLLGAPVLIASIGAEMAFRDNVLSSSSIFKVFRKQLFPLWICCIFLVLLHNFMLSVSMIDGEVYSFQEILQRIWNILFCLSDGEEPLSHSVWVIRCLIFASAVFAFLNSYFIPSKSEKNHNFFCKLIGAYFCISIIQLLFNLDSMNLFGGGQMEFLSIGWLLSGYLFIKVLLNQSVRFFVIVCSLVLLIVYCVFSDPSLQTELNSSLLLIPSAFCSCWLLFTLSHFFVNSFPRSYCVLRLIGRNYIYIICTFLLVFKLISIIKIASNGLSWDELSMGWTIQSGGNDSFYLLYVVGGITIPTLTVYLWKELDKKYDLTLKNVLIYLYLGLRYLGVALYRGSIWLGKFLWRITIEVVRNIKDMLKASNPNEE